MSAESLGIPKTMLVLKNISFSRGAIHKRGLFKLGSYRKSNDQFSELSARAEQGTIVALLGDSGIGKTSILRLILGLERLSAGEVSWKGEILQSANYTKSVAQRGFAYVAQDTLLFPHLSVIDNVCFGLNLLSQSPSALVDKSMAISEKKKISTFEQKRRSQEVLVELQIDALQDKWPNQLSGGQQKRVALARALVMNADLVLLDEPFNSLDQDLKHAVQTTLFQRFKKSRTTVIWSTHDVEGALRFADYLWILDEQSKLVEGTVGQLYRSPPSLPIAERLGEFDKLNIKDIITYDQSWVRFLQDKCKLNGNLVIGLRHHEWSLQPPCDLLACSVEDTESLQIGLNTESSKILKLNGRVLGIRDSVKWQEVTLELISSTEIDHVSDPKGDLMKKSSIHNGLGEMRLDLNSDKSRSLLRLDLPKRPRIRMTLATSFTISIGQTLQIYYLGEPMVLAY